MIGWRTYGTLIGRNEFGLQDVGFGKKQKAKAGNTDGDLFLCLSWSPLLRHIIRLWANPSCLLSTFVSLYSTNWHDLGIMELGQRSHLY